MACSLLRRVAAPAIALVVLAAGLALVMSTAGAQASEVEVRIAARRLDSGELEFALQQRDDRSWGERRRPDQHHFPADPPPPPNGSIAPR